MSRNKLVILVSLLCAACTSKEETPLQEPPKVPVLVVRPIVKEVPVHVEAIGTIKPSRFVEVRPELTAVVDAVLVQEGEWVEANTPLFVLDSRMYALKLKQEEAVLEQDRAVLVAAEKKCKRYESLVSKELLSKSEWEELEMQVAKAQAQLALDEAKVALAKLDFERCTIEAKCSGRLGKIDLHPGNQVSPTTLLTTISAIDPLAVEFAVTESEYASLSNKKLPVKIHSLVAPECAAEGHIIFLDNRFDAKSGTLLVAGRIANADARFLPGQTVRVQVSIAMLQDASLIPQKCVKYNQEGPYVYTVQQDASIALRQIALGAEYGSDVVVTDGLVADEAIITEGHARLFPGIKVVVVEGQP